MAKRLTEVRALAKILEDFHAHEDGTAWDQEDYAWACIQTLDKMREERVAFAVVVPVDEDNTALVGFGPYAKAETAHNAVSKGEIPAAQIFGRYAVAQIRHPRKAVADDE